MEILVWTKYWDTDLSEYRWHIKGHYVLVAETERAWLIQGWFFKKKRGRVGE